MGRGSSLAEEDRSTLREVLGILRDQNQKLIVVLSSFSLRSQQGVQRSIEEEVVTRGRRTRVKVGRGMSEEERTNGNLYPSACLTFLVFDFFSKAEDEIALWRI